MPSQKAPPAIYRLKITLLEIEPPIWRTLQVSSSIKLCCLHDAIQVVMGWTDSHLHQFEKDGKYWGVPEWDEFDELDLKDEAKTKLGTILKITGDSMIYSYDFGDDWQHEIQLEEIIPVEHELKVPICMGGERRCPPEDVGGVSGYEEFLEALLDPAHEDYERLVLWCGGHFIDGFDAAPVHDQLQRMRWPIRHRR